MKENYIFASYFTSKIDPQRKKFWKANEQDLYPLIGSVLSKGINLKIFHDCFDHPTSIKGCEWIRVVPLKEFGPTVMRWFFYSGYINKYKEKINNVFFVDSTDVVVLNNPFPYLHPEKFYSGDEWNNKVNSAWLQYQGKQINFADYNYVLDKYKNHTLINAGIVGGSVDLMLDFLQKLCYNHWMTSKNRPISTDMGVYNYTVWKNYSGILEHGSHINTRFKTFDKNNKTAWFRHK